MTDTIPERGSRRMSPRTGAIAESATLAVDAKAKALQAAGRPVIGFGAGEPDFATPDYIVQAAREAAQPPRYHPYTAPPSAHPAEPSQVLITNGGKQAVYNPFATLLDPGEEVLLVAPSWTTYPE